MVNTIKRRNAKTISALQFVEVARGLDLEDDLREEKKHGASKRSNTTQQSKSPDVGAKRRKGKSPKRRQRNKRRGSLGTRRTQLREKADTQPKSSKDATRASREIRWGRMSRPAKRLSGNPEYSGPTKKMEEAWRRFKRSQERMRKRLTYSRRLHTFLGNSLARSFL